MTALNILPSLSFLIVILLFAESCTNEKDVEPVSTNRLYVCYIEKSSENEKKPSSDIFITQQLNDTIEYGMCFGNKTRTINNNFDFKYLYVFDVYMDSNYGIGNQQYNESSSNASIESACKSYFVLIDKKNGLFVPKGSHLSFRGGYRFNTTS